MKKKTVNLAKRCLVFLLSIVTVLTMLPNEALAAPGPGRPDPEPKSHSITVNINDPAGGTVECPATCLEGEKFRLKITPSAGYELDYFEAKLAKGPGKPLKQYELTRDFTMGVDDVTINVYFKEIPTWKVRSWVNTEMGGIVQIEKPTLYAGESTFVNIEPAYGYEIENVSWVYDGKTVDGGTQSTLYFTADEKLPKDCKITVYFKEAAKWTITPNITNPEGGTVTFSKNPLYEGETCEATITPNPGWKIKSETWICDGKKQFNAGYYVNFKANEKLPKDTIFNVEFEKLPTWTITPNITNPEGGKVELSKNPLYEGEVCEITITPNPGWKIESETWMWNGSKQFNAGYQVNLKADEKLPKETIFNVVFEKLPTWTITPNITNPEGGKVELSKNPLYEGEVCEITITPNPGWKIKSETWMWNGSKQFNAGYQVNLKADEKLPKDTIFNVEFEKLPTWKVRSWVNTEQGGRVLIEKETLIAGESTKVTIEPSDGYEIESVSWEYDGKTVDGGTDSEFTITADEKLPKDCKITVYFKKAVKLYNIATNFNIPEAGTIYVPRQAKAGEEVNVKVNVNPDFKLVKVEVLNGNDPIAIAMMPESSFEMPENDVTIKVYFERILAYKVETVVNPVEGGTVEITKTEAKAGETVKVTCKANDGYQFKSLDVDGKSGLNVYKNWTKETFSFTMPSEDAVVTAYFELIPMYDIDTVVSPAESGKVEVSKTQAFEGEFITVKCIANDGYKFTSMNIIGKNALLISLNNTDDSFSFAMPNEGVDVTAFFEKLPEPEKEYVTLTFMPGEGKGEKKDVKVEKGKEYTFPENFYGQPNNVKKVFGGWKIADVIYQPGDTFVPEKDVNVLCWWVMEKEPEPVYYNIVTEVIPSEGGSITVSKTQAEAGEKINYSYTVNDGYHFVSFEIIPSSDGISKENYFIMPSRDVKLVLTVEKDVIPEPNYFTLSFDANGGKGTMDSITDIEGTKVRVPECKFTKDGFTFDGWMLDKKDFTEKEVILDRNITLVAKWKEVKPEPIFHSLNFDPNGGEGMMPSIMAIEGTKVNIPKCEFYRDGYKFVCWMLDGKEYSDKEITLDKDYTLVAKWKEVKPEPKNFTLRFDANGGKGTMDPITKAEGTKVTIPDTKFTRDGYSFGGWMLDGKDYSKKTIVLDKDYTLVAKWNKNADPKPVKVYYTLSFDPNGGNGTMDSITCEAGTKVKIPTNKFTRDGYIFAGWMLDGNDLKQGEVTLNRNIKLVAKWIYIKQLPQTGGPLESAALPLAFGSLLIVAGAMLLIFRKKRV